MINFSLSDSDKMAVRVQENSMRWIEEHPRFEVRCPKDNAVGSPKFLQASTIEGFPGAYGKHDA